MNQLLFTYYIKCCTGRPTKIFGFKPKSHDATLLAANALAACNLAYSPIVTAYLYLEGGSRWLI